MAATFKLVYVMILLISLYHVAGNFEDISIECMFSIDCPQIKSNIFRFKCIEDRCKIEFIYQRKKYEI
ncbi:putative Late nodulin [Medicago truncatula]|uniref:Nodule Cysteine-Rich (NCR) secreted peptide n=1 Tax=Medicago truncatula TaxID=3880 RepID=G7K5E0_MEDTR|nr:Nodule Cysteine-Rich (NCR) secreted peptide [Medicago truncatula]RHN54604.1 putative Late nodulin [Medicago truncatula]